MTDHLQKGARRCEQFFLLLDAAAGERPRLAVSAFDALGPVRGHVPYAIDNQRSNRETSEDHEARADAAKVARRTARYSIPNGGSWVDHCVWPLAKISIFNPSELRSPLYCY